MKPVFLFPCLLFCSAIVYGQAKFDSVLYKKLKIMRNDDQKWRIESYKIFRNEHSDYDQKTIDKNMARTDSLNEAEAKRIFNRYGYPGYSLVGDAGSNWFWTIVQHCDDDIAFQQKVLEQMDKEVKANNASGEDYGYLEDRVLISQGKKQLYGTQVHVDPKTNKATPFAIEDSTQVDARRKAVGMMPLADYLKLIEKGN